MINLKYFDISDYNVKLGTHSADILQILKFLSEECPNLTRVYLNNLGVTNKGFTPLVKKCKKLKELDLTSCSRLTDASISKTFQHCLDIEKLNLSNCRLLDGTCFHKIKECNQKLQIIILDNCELVFKYY